MILRGGAWTVALALATAPTRPAVAQWAISVDAGFGWGIAADTAVPRGPAVGLELVKGFPPENFRWGAFANVLDIGKNARANAGLKVALGSLNPTWVDLSASASLGLALDFRNTVENGVEDTFDAGFLLGAGAGAAVRCGPVWLAVTLDWLVQSLTSRRNSYALARLGLRLPFSHPSR